MSDSHETVLIDKLHNSQVSIDPTNDLPDERRVKEIVDAIVHNEKIVTVQSVIGEVVDVVMDENDIDGEDITALHIGCIKVNTGSVPFPILPKNESGWIFPLDSQVKCYPIPGELVAIINYGSQTYYFQPLNINNSINNNISLGTMSTQQDGIATTKNIPEYIKNFKRKTITRPVKNFPGDWAINGRNDQSIRIGTDVITNTDAVPNPDNAVIKISISSQEENARNTLLPRKEDINLDPASLWMTRNETVKMDIEPRLGDDFTPNELSGTQIVGNSDRITLNTRSGKDAGQINLFAGNTANIFAKNNANLVGNNVLIGDVEDNNLQPAVLGDNLVTLLHQLFQQLNSFASQLSSATGVGNIGGPVPLPSIMGAGANMSGYAGTAGQKEALKNLLLSKNVKVSKRPKTGL